MLGVVERKYTGFIQGCDQRLQVRQREVRCSRFHAYSVVLGHVCRAPRPIISHVKRATIDIQIRTEFTHSRAINLATIERTADSLRNSMAHRLTLGLLGQGLLSVTTLGDINADAGDVATTGRVNRRKLEHEPMMNRAVARRQTFNTLLWKAYVQHLEIVFVSVCGADRRQPVETRPSFQKAELLSKNFFERLVNVNIPSFCIFHESDCRTVVHETVENRMALAQRFF